MNTVQQALHIFKKDVRFLRIEIGVLVAISWIFAWKAFHVHTGFAIPENTLSDSVTYVPSYSTTNSTMFLVYLAAVLLTVRVIQADPVPGTQEYWFTRPYRWKSVLMAKAMFIAVCVNLPILMARIAIIVLDGFPLTSNLWGLMWTQVLMALQLLVPVAALAAVTASLTPFIFTAVSLLATGALVQAFISLRKPGEFQAYLPFLYGWIRTSIEELILVTIGVLVVYIQYRYRRTTLSRALGMGAVALGVMVYVWMPTSFAMDVQSRFWHSAAASPIELGIAPPADKLILENGTFSVTFELPVELKGLPEEMTALPNWLRVQIEDSDHRSIIRETGTYVLRSDTLNLHSWTTQMEIPASFLESERGKPLTLHASVFLSLFRKDRTVSVPFATNRWLDLPGGFRCFNGFFQHCEKTSAYPSPLVTVFSSGMNFIWSRPASRSPLETSMDLKPVESSFAMNRGFAAVTQVTVWEPVANLRREIEIQNFPLTDYVDIER